MGRKVYHSCSDTLRFALKTKFWLDENTYRELAQQVQVIYHNAANVNHITSYRELKADNVTGTLNLLRFAATHTAKVFYYISTISVFSDISIIDDAGGYTQTKYVSEQLIKHAREKGLLATIYCPSMISGDTVHRCCNYFQLGIMTNSMLFNYWILSKYRLYYLYDTC
jgi:thioester reductase-like protein